MSRKQAKNKPNRGCLSRPRRLAALQTRTAQPKRNEPCPCGSGRKYKKCCQRRPKSPPLVDRILSTVPAPAVEFARIPDDDELAETD